MKPLSEVILTEETQPTNSARKQVADLAVASALQLGSEDTHKLLGIIAAMTILNNPHISDSYAVSAARRLVQFAQRSSNG